MQRSTGLLILLALVVGFVLFKVKYEVVGIEQELIHNLAQITREEETIHILKAEWSHLNEPQRLQKLAEKYLEIGPIKTEQLVAIVTDYGEKMSIKFLSPGAYPASIKGTK